MAQTPPKTSKTKANEIKDNKDRSHAINITTSTNNRTKTPERIYLSKDNQRRKSTDKTKNDNKNNTGITFISNVNKKTDNNNNYINGDIYTKNTIKSSKKPFNILLGHNTEDCAPI